MSAYVVDRDHIDFMVQAALAGATDSQGWSAPHGDFSWFHDGRRIRVEIGAEIFEGGTLEIVSPDVLGQRLVDECVRSVHARYPDTEPDAGDLPGPCDAYYMGPYIFEPIDTGKQLYSIARGLTLAVQPVANTATVAHQISHYEYQSCEHPEWRESEAFAFCAALKDRLLGTLPGAGDAVWGYRRPERVS